MEMSSTHSEAGSFDRPPLEGTVAPTAPVLSVGADESPPSSLEGCTLFHRYQVLGLIGRGGFGEVYLGRDLVTGDDVAIKRIGAFTRAGVELARREICALAFLRIPGVVQLRDDGRHAGAWCLITDHVPGPHVFGEGPRPWVEIHPILIQLLRTLTRVHAAGIVHRDLKPRNIRLDAVGRPVILDFGIARGQRLAPDLNRRVEGSWRYMSPEQRAGLPADGRTDLFALGRVLREAMTGDVLGDLPAEVPAPAREVLRAMVAPDPKDRPSSAALVLEALGGGALLGEVSHVLRRLPDQPAWDEPALSDLFTGPRAFVHVPEDAAAVLYSRTEGRAERVRAELVDWLRLGQAEKEGDRIRVSRAVVAHLALEPARRAFLLAPPEQRMEIARREATRLGEAGRHGEAAAWLRQALEEAHHEGDEAAEEPLLQQLAELALASEVREEVDLALTAARSAWWPRPSLEPLQGLLEAGRALFTGEARRALELVALVPALPTERLEIWRRGIEATGSNARPIAEHRAFLEGLAGWARTPLRRAKLAGWVGNLRFREARYLRAARAHRRAADGKERSDEKISSTCNVALALLEAGRPAEAREIARQVADDAARCRLPRYEALAVWLVRCTGYRLEERDVPRPELVEAAALVGPKEEALLALSEAAWAWRTGARELAASLATTAQARFAGTGNLNGAVVSGALAIAADAENAPTMLRAVLARVEASAPGIAAQAYALLSLGVPRPDPRWPALVRAAAQRGRFRVRNRRREVLSIAEAIRVSAV